MLVLNLHIEPTASTCGERMQECGLSSHGQSIRDNLLILYQNSWPVTKCYTGRALVNAAMNLRIPLKKRYWPAEVLLVSQEYCARWTSWLVNYMKYAEFNTYVSQHRSATPETASHSFLGLLNMISSQESDPAVTYACDQLYIITYCFAISPSFSIKDHKIICEKCTVHQKKDDRVL
jgi:hypothetical protein